MTPERSRLVRLFVLLAAMALVAGIYSVTVFSNLCVDGDTLDWAVSLAPLEGTLTFSSCIAVKGWFTKFHLLMFAMVYAFAKAYAPWGGWDFLAGFRICTLACAVLTVPALYLICRGTMRSFPVMLATSLVPLFTLGYSWLITTADDNPLANFFNLVFVACVLAASGAIRPDARERRPLLWAFAAGAAAGLSLASHLKNIVALPLVLVPAAVRPPSRAGRVRIAAAALLGFFVVFGSLYGLYWSQSAGESAASKLDFWVFHRVPGRFILTPPHPLLRDHLAFVWAGIRSSLYAFQELYIHTDLYDRDLLGPALIALFFAAYLCAAFRERRRRAVGILFVWFLLDAGHSLVYDSWVVERWDSFTLPVFLTIGIGWDGLLAEHRSRVRGLAVSAPILALYGALVWANVSSTRLLLGITANRIDCRIEEKRWWAEKLKYYFYFDHREVYRLARGADRWADDRTWFLSPRLMQPPDSTPQSVLMKYLSLYSRCWRERRIDDPKLIGVLAAGGGISRLLYVDRMRIPCYVTDGRPTVLFDPASTSPLIESPQVTLMQASFDTPPPQGPDTRVRLLERARAGSDS